MDDGELEFSEYVVFPNSDSSSNVQETMSIDSVFEEVLKSAHTCTHTHTCNPPGPDTAHTHTCYHTHTRVFSSEEDDLKHDKDKTVSKPRRASGNREAVKKYREKKKAHTAYMEEEVKKLRLVNQQLTKKLQGQAILEAEVLRLRALLADFRGKIDGELGVFPFQKQCNSNTTSKDGNCGLQSVGGMIGVPCENDTLCFHPQENTLLEAGCVGGNKKMTVSRDGNCQPAIIDCQMNKNDGPNAKSCGLPSMETLVSSASHHK